MTTDRIQDKKLELRARLIEKDRYKTARPEKGSGFELSRIQNFVDGGHDRFDVLESHTANNQMRVKANQAANSIDADLKETPLFQSLLTKLKTQMRDIVEL